MSELHICIEGDKTKPALVLGHPLGMNLQVWDDITSHLKEDFYIIRWDLPGHGHSPAIAPTVTSLKEEALVTPLIEKCDALGVTKFHYVGTSIGGVIGQQLLIDYSERLLSLTLTNTGAKIGTLEFWLNRQKDVTAQGLKNIATALVPRWFSEDSIKSTPALMEFWQQQLMKVDNHSYGLLCAWLGNTDLTKKLGIKNVKTQLICGERDVATTPELMDNLASLMEIDSVTILDSVGHVPSVESPKELTAILKSFL